jgi:hypothetical protein
LPRNFLPVILLKNFPFVSRKTSLPEDRNKLRSDNAPASKFLARKNISARTIQKHQKTSFIHTYIQEKNEMDLRLGGKIPNVAPGQQNNMYVAQPAQQQQIPMAKPV